MEFDVAIIGAGAVGLAIAMQLSEKRSCLVLEQHNTFGVETSSRNSEVVHSGIYYNPNSLKSQLCIEGNRLIYEHCDKYSVEYNKCGKFVISTSDDESRLLLELKDNAEQSGAKGIELVSQKFIQEKEPSIIADNALFAAETGILNAHRFMQSLEALAIGNGATFAYNTKCTAIEQFNSFYRIYLTDNSGETFFIDTKFVINSAGLHSDEIARMVGINTDLNNLNLSYCKGCYFKIRSQPKFSFSYLIYPVPQKHQIGLGIHLTIDLNGQARLGPDSQYIEREQDYSVSEELKQKFFGAAAKYIKDLSIEDIEPDYSGIRPKLQKSGENFRDFYITEESAKGFANFYNLIGIESPGLTSSLAIARYVDSILNS